MKDETKDGWLSKLNFGDILMLDTSTWPYFPAGTSREEEPYLTRELGEGWELQVWGDEVLWATNKSSAAVARFPFVRGWFVVTFEERDENDVGYSWAEAGPFPTLKSAKAAALAGWGI